MGRKEKKAQQGAYDFLECLWGMKYDPDYAHQFRNKEETGLSPQKILAVVRDKYLPVGSYLARKNFIVTGVDIDVFIRDSASGLCFDDRYRAQSLEYEPIVGDAISPVELVLPNPRTLEKLHFTGPQQSCKLLTNFIINGSRY